MIHGAVLTACDASDGLKDGLLSDPQSCHPDFGVLQCGAEDAPDCRTAAQVRSARTLISPATTHSGKVLFPPLEPGTELRWGRMAGGPGPADLFVDEFRYVVYHDPTWDWHGFDLERDGAKAHAIDRNADELNPHLAAFAKHGKLILYHGWADQQVAPGSTIEFYESIRSLSPHPKRANDWVRLFMAPGMAHCVGGEGPDSFDSLSALERWVEQDQAPQRIIAAHRTAGHVDRTRPLCPYPKVARYTLLRAKSRGRWDIRPWLAEFLFMTVSNGCQSRAPCRTTLLTKRSALAGSSWIIRRNTRTMKSGSERACSKSRRRASPMWKRAANWGWLKPVFSRMSLTSRASAMRLSCSSLSGGLSESFNARASASASLTFLSRVRSLSERRDGAPRLRVKKVSLIFFALMGGRGAGRDDAV